MTTFKHGDRVRNVNPSSRYYNEIKDKIGTFVFYWDKRYTLRNACDVEYPDVTDLYGRPSIAQSADDLELVVPHE
jgi:hypothetical protein